MRTSKTYYQQRQKYDEKTKKETKWQDSPRQDLNPDHGPQHGAVKCSTHWAAGNLSTLMLNCKLMFQVSFALQRSGLETQALFLRGKSGLPWFAIDSISKYNSFYKLRFSFSLNDNLLYFFGESQCYVVRQEP